MDDWRSVFPNPGIFNPVAIGMLDNLVLLNPIPTVRGPSTRWSWLFSCMRAGLITRSEYQDLFFQANGMKPPIQIAKEAVL